MNREHIRDVLFAYCRGVDRRDWDLLRSCYHSDAVDDHSVLVGGPQDLVDWLDRRHANMPMSVHMVMNVGFLEESADRVLTETYCMAVQVLKAGSLSRNTVGARYLDVFEERGDGWKIARRTVVLEWIDAIDAKSDFLDSRYLRSTRDRTDPLYKHLKSGAQ
jgi:3-phenylpropionate/cinnamic acid dioxygenase small subunit